MKTVIIGSLLFILSVPGAYILGNKMGIKEGERQGRIAQLVRDSMWFDAFHSSTTSMVGDCNIRPESDYMVVEHVGDMSAPCVKQTGSVNVNGSTGSVNVGNQSNSQCNQLILEKGKLVKKATPCSSY